jgi:hypothetical protein
MTAQSPIRSQAQLAMLKRVASDAAYAAERGISQVSAQALLDDHVKAGSPALPDRVKLAAPNPPARPAKKYKLLGAR